MKNINGYKPDKIEKKWQDKWVESKIYEVDLKSAKKPFYNLMMFPYPSAEGLHVGNMYAQTGVDIYGRFMRMNEFDVFEPVGLDGFGIHAENFALKIGENPMEYSKITEKNFYKQMHAIGLATDWSKTIETYKPEYYKWTQWLFVELFKKGLAYRKSQLVNYCPSCKTVLADEQVIEAKCERCGADVTKKQLEQWFLHITKYSDKLLNNIENLNWSDKVKTAQKQWIGKSKGLEIVFKVENSTFEIPVWTKYWETIHGVIFLVVAPEYYTKIKDLVPNSIQKDVSNYVNQSLIKTTVERSTEDKDKSGIFTGIYAVNPVNKNKIPVWIADYVMMDVGTGAVMGVPAHDARDFDFAIKYELPIIQVVKYEDEAINRKIENRETSFEGKGILINSGEFTGRQSIGKDKEIMAEVLIKSGIARWQVAYHLRDWLISRQRYWGCPIPMIFCENCKNEAKSWFSENNIVANWDASGWYPEDSLPVVLPYIKNYKPLGTGKSPLSLNKEFVEARCPNCGAVARRETDVSDTFLDSSWYFFRYPSLTEEKYLLNIDITKKWLPVNMYIGGAEHSVLHLLYSRFITMFLHDQKVIEFEEPFTRFYAHGLLIKDGRKMSKSKGNVVIPDEYIKKFGADTLRIYLMFIGPYNQGGDFRDTGIEGMHRFVKRVWTLLTTKVNVSTLTSNTDKSFMYGSINGVTKDLTDLKFNTAIAKIMMFYNHFSSKDGISLEVAEVLLLMLAPFTPHLSEELWQLLHPNQLSFSSIHSQSWPKVQKTFLSEEKIDIAIQVNNKFRDIISIENNMRNNEKEIQKVALAQEKIIKFIGDESIEKVIYIPGKAMNFVTKKSS